MTTYWLKIAIFPYPSHFTPSIWVTPFAFLETLYRSW